MRLDQFLSARTMYSRRELRQMIQKEKRPWTALWCERQTSTYSRTRTRFA